MPANALAEDHLLTLNVLKTADLDSAILRSGQGTVVSDVLELLPHGQVFLQDVAISVGVRVGLAVVENRLGLFFRSNGTSGWSELPGAAVAAASPSTPTSTPITVTGRARHFSEWVVLEKTGALQGGKLEDNSLKSSLTNASIDKAVVTSQPLMSTGAIVGICAVGLFLLVLSWVGFLTHMSNTVLEYPSTHL